MNLYYTCAPFYYLFKITHTRDEPQIGIAIARGKL